MLLTECVILGRRTRRPMFQKVKFYKNESICNTNITFLMFIFYVQGSVRHEYMSIIVQRDATIYSLFISVNCSTCFGWYLHLSSGAHITVSTASVISVTVTVTCR
jgi:hypothetical protein